MHEFMKQWGSAIIVAVAVLLLLGTILGMKAVLQESTQNVELPDVSQYLHDDSHYIKTILKSPENCQDTGTMRTTCSDCDYDSIEDYSGQHYINTDTHRCMWCNEVITASYTIAEETLGDINNDGVKDSYDVDFIRKTANNTIHLSKEEQARADINKDGIIDNTDANILLAYINEVIPNLVIMQEEVSEK